MPKRSVFRRDLRTSLHTFSASCGAFKEECLGRIVFFGESSSRNAVREFVVHYHAERNHQGLENRLITAGEGLGQTTGQIECRERLGGLLRYYYRKAA